MTLGLYDQERRRRRRFWVQALKTLLFVGGLLMVGLFSYQMGVERQKAREVAEAQAEEDLRQAKAEVERELAQAQQATRAAEARAAELEARIERSQPQGETARLNAMLAEKLAAGVDPARLAFVLSEMRPTRNCEPAETRRMVLTLPQQRGTPASVTLAGTVTVTGEGMPAKNTRGQNENWYDPAQPVKVRFADVGGKKGELEGLLPLRKSMVVGGSEIRFTVNPGPRSFIEVRAERCPFP